MPKSYLDGVFDSQKRVFLINIQEPEITDAEMRKISYSEQTGTEQNRPLFEQSVVLRGKRHSKMTSKMLEYQDSIAQSKKAVPSVEETDLESKRPSFVLAEAKIAKIIEDEAFSELTNVVKRFF